MQPAFYERRLRPYNGFKGKFLFRLLMLVAAVFIGNAVWKFGEKQIARHQAARQTVEAESLIGQGCKIEAQVKLRAALGYDPRNIQANRLTARLLDEQGDPRALEFYRFVVLNDSILPGELAEINFSSGDSGFFSESADFSASGDRFVMEGTGIELGPNATIEDAVALARAGVNYGNHRVAREVAITVGKKWDKPEFPHLINAAILERSGDFLSAEREFRTAVTRRETPETLEALANFLLKRQDNVSVRTSEAAMLLERAANLQGGQKSLDALKRIITLRLAQPERLPALLARYRELSSGNEAGLQYADSVELEFFPAQREKILEGVVARSAKAPLATRIELARWLLSQNDPARAARVLPLKDSFADQMAFETAIETLLAQKNWQVAAEALGSASNPLEPHKTAALRATAATRSGDARATEMWLQSFDQYNGSPEVFLFLLEKAASSGRWDLVLERLPSQFNDPAWAMRTFEKILPLARSMDDPEVLIKIHGMALNTRMLGGDPILRNRAAFDRLLAGKSVPEDELTERAVNFPENPSMRVTRALAFLQNGSKSRALYEIEEVEPRIEPEKLAPQERAAFAAVLAANGRMHEAGKIASSIPSGSLTGMEMAFLREHLSATANLD